MEKLNTSNVSVSNGNLKYPIVKINFYSKFAFKTFPCYVANTNTESLKSLHTLFDTYLDYMLAKIEANCTVRNVQNLNFWTKKRVLSKPFLTKRWPPFCKTFLWLKQLFDGKLLIFRLPFFGVQKIMVIQHVKIR